MTVANFDDESKLLDIDREPETHKRLPRWAATLIILVLTASASFGLGMLAQQSINGESPSGEAAASAASGQIIGDSSTHMFYLPWCSQVSAIRAANTVRFASEQAAESKGYMAGKDCAGL